ncbi:MAG: hypothetical protein CMF23_08235 [Ignavibacteriae bacterium]|nr:hypothetical protein [Ignavibacteriota bacterium]
MRKLILILILINLQIYGKEDSTDVNPVRLTLISTATVGGFIYAYAIQNDMWWKGEKSKFHSNWNQDWRYALGSDKYGHFYFGTLISKTYSDLFYWSGISKDKSKLYGAVLSFSYQTFIEIRDGFSKDYGFSWGDFSANLLGSSLQLLKCEIDFLNFIDFKISYYPSERFKNNSNQYILDDYESTYNWISINSNKLISEKIPSFINIAVGHSVKRLDFSDSYHEIFLSLDWNFKGIKTDSSFLKKLFEYLDFYHFPAPAVKVYPDLVWYGLKF